MPMVANSTSRGSLSLSAVADQSLWELSGKALSKNISDKGDFMRRSTRRVGGERKAMSVCQTHEFRAFAPLGGAHSTPPFLATTNVPSIKHSAKSISPRSCRSRAKASSTARSVPSLDHSWNLLWQVWYGGNDRALVGDFNMPLSAFWLKQTEPVSGGGGGCSREHLPPRVPCVATGIHAQDLAGMVNSWPA